MFFCGGKVSTYLFDVIFTGNVKSVSNTICYLFVLLSFSGMEMFAEWSKFQLRKCGVHSQPMIVVSDVLKQVSISWLSVTYSI